MKDSRRNFLKGVLATGAVVSVPVAVHAIAAPSEPLRPTWDQLIAKLNRKEHLSSDEVLLVSDYVNRSENPFKCLKTWGALYKPPGTDSLFAVHRHVAMKIVDCATEKLGVTQGKDGSLLPDPHNNKDMLA